MALHYTKPEDCIRAREKGHVYPGYACMKAPAGAPDDRLWECVGSSSGGLGCQECLANCPPPSPPKPPIKPVPGHPEHEKAEDLLLLLSPTYVIFLMIIIVLFFAAFGFFLLSVSKKSPGLELE